MLARPAVEKAEKPKQPKGRAHKRHLYNRRFVNVVIGPGGKRRANAQGVSWTLLAMVVLRHCSHPAARRSKSLVA
jgi:uncharacterized linocin/CFP29 family protein